VCNELPRRMFFVLVICWSYCYWGSYYPCTFYSNVYVLPAYLVSNVHCIPAYSDLISCHPHASLPNDCVSLSFITDGHVSPQQVVHDATFCGMTRTLAPDARMTWTLCLIVRGWHEIWYQISEGCNELLGLVVWGWHEFLNEKLRDDMNCGMTCCANVLYWD